MNERLWIIDFDKANKFLWRQEGKAFVWNGFRVVKRKPTALWTWLRGGMKS